MLLIIVYYCMPHPPCPLPHWCIISLAQYSFRSVTRLGATAIMLLMEVKWLSLTTVSLNLCLSKWTYSVQCCHWYFKLRSSFSNTVVVQFNFSFVYFSFCFLTPTALPKCLWHIKVGILRFNLLFFSLSLILNTVNCCWYIYALGLYICLSVFSQEGL